MDEWFIVRLIQKKNVTGNFGYIVKITLVLHNKVTISIIYFFFFKLKWLVPSLFLSGKEASFYYVSFFFFFCMRHLLTQ